LAYGKLFKYIKKHASRQYVTFTFIKLITSTPTVAAEEADMVEHVNTCNTFQNVYICHHVCVWSKVFC